MAAALELQALTTAMEDLDSPVPESSPKTIELKMQIERICVIILSLKRAKREKLLLAMRANNARYLIKLFSCGYLEQAAHSGIIGTARNVPQLIVLYSVSMP